MELAYILALNKEGLSKIYAIIQWLQWTAFYMLYFYILTVSTLSSVCTLKFKGCFYFMEYPAKIFTLHVDMTDTLAMNVPAVTLRFIATDRNHINLIKKP
jgi:hypothetical protein